MTTFQPHILPHSADCDAHSFDEAGSVMSHTGHGVKEPANREATVVVVESRSLIRDCLVKNLQSGFALNIVGVASLDECQWLVSAIDVGLVLLSCPGGPDSKTNLDMLTRASEALPGIPILILCDTLCTPQADPCPPSRPSGYISTSMPLDVAVAAIRVVQSGRMLPRRSQYMAVEPELAPTAEEPTSHDWLRDHFTTRQIAVIDALRKGKANKIIAFELNMKESTVKVHVRNIMKRLKAHNRTEVSYIANQLLSGPAPDEIRSQLLIHADEFAEGESQ